MEGQCSKPCVVQGLTYLVMGFGDRGKSGGGDRKSRWKQGTARFFSLCPSPRQRSALANGFSWKHLNHNFYYRMNTHTHELHTDWVKTKHTSMTQYFLVDLTLDSEWTSLIISPRWQFLLLSLPHPSSYREEWEDGQHWTLCGVENKAKTPYARTSSRAWMWNSSWFEKTGIFSDVMEFKIY